MKACQILDVPVVVSEQVPKKLGYTHSDISPPFLKKYEKTSFSMQAGKHADAEVAIVVGIETHVCILQTCLDLLESGTQVHVVTDAVSSQRAQDREIALRRLETSGAFLTTAESLVFQMLRDSQHKHFRTISKLCIERAKRDSMEKKKVETNNEVIRLNTSNEFKFKEYVSFFFFHTQQPT